ncbi:MAG TPA: glycosyltransferase 87 family protein [Chthoniobacterales bacterium]
MKLTPSQRIYCLGAILFVSLFVCSLNFGRTGSPSFLVALAVAGIAYLFAIREFLSTSRFPQKVVIIGLGLAALWHGQFLRMPPGPDDDIHRYVWDGRVQRFGYNPYLIVPNDPAFSWLHTAETRTLNHPDVPTPYPAGAELFFRAVTAIHESTFALKIVFVLCDVAIVLLLFDILRRSRQGMHWVLAFAWNPLLATEVAGSGHIDIVGTLLLLTSFYALGRHWRTVAAVMFGLAVTVKFLPIILLPLYWKRLRIRDAVLATIVVGLLYVPFLQQEWIPIGSLGTYVKSFRFNDPVFAIFERVTGPQVATALAVLLGFLVALLMRNGSAALSADAFAWPMASSLLCAPVVYPWYLLWMLPLVRSLSTLPIVIWTVSIIPTYVVWYLRARGGPWLLPGWVTPLEYGCVGAAGAIILWHRFVRSTAPRRSTERLARGAEQDFELPT